MSVIAQQGQLPLAQLEDYWLTCKQAENEARQDRLNVEAQILEHPDALLKEVGSTTLGQIKVTTGYTRSFDQEKLAEAINEVPAELWPFKSEYKEIKAGTDYLERNEPELWEQIRPALTIKPKKAAFAVIPTKKDA